MFKSKNNAFTLVELLVVIGIIALLTSLLMPALAKAKSIAQGVVCASNLRQLSMAAHLYASEEDDHLPLATMADRDKGTASDDLIDHMTTWNTDVITNRTTGERTTRSGLLWRSEEIPGEIQQCPGYKGDPSWAADTFTGYNYNTSYIGEEILGPNKKLTPKLSIINFPSTCPLFGEGEMSDGNANKFMRAPLVITNDRGLRDFRMDILTRYAGAQVIRHSLATFVAYADGHVAGVRKLFKGENYQLIVAYGIAAKPKFEAGNLGFLSDNNTGYDLE